MPASTLNSVWHQARTTLPTSASAASGPATTTSGPAPRDKPTHNTEPAPSKTTEPVTFSKWLGQAAGQDQAGPTRLQALPLSYTRARISRASSRRLACSTGSGTGSEAMSLRV